jgi:hypothetical protein
MLCFTSTDLQVFSHRMLSKADAARVGLHGSVMQSPLVAQPREVNSGEIREIKCGGGTLEVIFDPPAMMRPICAINSSRRRSIPHTGARCHRS